MLRCTLALLLLSLPLLAQTPAFPGAEGFGANNSGGRGGDVYHVTNLNDSGPGSLRYGIQNAKGPRTIVFDVSGTIQLASKLDINKPNLTLAGQTAPGDGITIAGWTVSITKTKNVIVRYLRFRAGDQNCPTFQDDALDVDQSTDVILDHVSASWSIDESLSVTDSDRVTVQWSFITEALDSSCHEKGEHGYGSLLRYGTGGITLHHNLYAHNHSRNPRIGDNLRVDFVNNIIYNYGNNAGEASYTGEASEGSPRINYIGNYIIAGPSTPSSRRTRAFNGGSPNTLVYAAGNLIDGNLNQKRDGTDTGYGMFIGEYTRQSARFDFPSPTTEDAAAAYRKILDSGGASLKRDPIDLRIQFEVDQDGGKVINSPKDIGGYPSLKSLPTPLDTDQDGIPDSWELARGLNPRDPADGAKLAANGYSNLELYLNELATGAPLPPSPTPIGTTILDDTFADGNSQNQDLANNSIRLFNGRTNNTRTDAPGSLTLDMTPAGTGSEAVWGFFTPAGQPVSLSIGDKLTVALTFSVNGFKANGQDIRWGVLDSLGTRNTANLGGGHNDATFIGDTGYGLQFYASGNGSPMVIGRRTVLTNANMFNNFADFTTLPGSGANTRQPLTDDTPYTLNYSIERTSATDTRLTATITGGTLDGLTYSATESSSTPNTTFDSFAFRIAGTNFANKLTVSRVRVQLLPAPPVITIQPQPPALTLQIDSSVSLTLAASGTGLSYQWQKNGTPLRNNPTATTPSLTLDRLMLTDAGNYTCVISNSGGAVVSESVTLGVSTTPVPPPPTITVQPANTTVTRGQRASLTVVASGTNLLYQWFKSGSPIPGARQATLTIAAAQNADSGAYSVTVSNSSGVTPSRAAALTVVSPMLASSVSPWPGYTGLCIDSQLTLEFTEAPAIGTSGRIRVIDSTGKTVDTIDMASRPQTRPIGGVTYNYLPLRVSGNTVQITLHQPLAYNETYSVLVEPGVILDSTGTPWGGFSDPATWTFRTRPTGPAAGQSTLVVGADDNGDFCTVQGAIDAVPANNTIPVTIRVRPGTYNEINYVPSNKPFLTIRGDSREATIIQYPNNANLNAGNSRAMFGVDAPDFRLEGITLWNTTPKGGSQAEAFRGNNQRILLNRVTLKSFQDTVLLQGAAYIKDSYIEGDVDFLWGNGAVYIQNSEIKALSSGGYYTQIRNDRGQNGYVFANSKITAADGVTGMWLARIDPTVFPFSQVVYLNCQMGPHIAPAGWLLNNATTAPSVEFLEYRSLNPDGSLLNISQRAPFSRQLTDAEVTRFLNPVTFLNGWDPEAALRSRP